MNAIQRQIRSMLTVERRAGGFHALFRVSKDLIVFPDHFRGFPLLPGVCMVQAVLLAAAEALNIAELRLKEMKNAKITQPVLPGEEIVIDAALTPAADGNVAIKAVLIGSGKRCAEFSLIARPASSRKDKTA